MNQNESYIDNYGKKERQRKELQCRLSMGLYQLRYKPYSILLLLALCILFWIAWKNRTKLLPVQFIPDALLPICTYAISALLITAFVILVLVTIRQLGTSAATKIESQLVMAFDGRDLRGYGYPILKSIRYDKASHIKTMVFYSHIPLERWQKKKGKIEEETGMYIRSIGYQGKGKKSNYKEVEFICGKRIKNMELHDEELDRELRDVD